MYRRNAALFDPKAPATQEPETRNAGKVIDQHAFLRLMPDSSSPPNCFAGILGAVSKNHEVETSGASSLLLLTD